MDKSLDNIYYFLFDNEIILKHFQIPIVPLIILGFFYLSKNIDPRAYKGIAIGWFFNLLYLICSWLEDYFVYLQFEANYITTINLFGYYFDLASSYFILYCIRQYLNTANWKPAYFIPHNNTLIILYIVTGLSQTFFKLFPDNYPSEFNYILLNEIFKSTIMFITFYGFAKYIYLKFIEYNKTVKYVKFVLYCYALIQFLSIPILYNEHFNSSNKFYFLDFSINLTALGFLIGLISKIVLLLFIISISVDKIALIEKKSVYQLGLKKILSKAFHELAYPIDAIEKCTTLSLKETPPFKMDGKVRTALKIIDSSNLHNKAIIAAYTKIYHLTAKNGHSIDQDDFQLSFGESEKIEAHNITTIIQMVVSMIKIANTDSMWKIQAEFSPKCVMECKISELYQVFRNLLKNAIEAVDPISGKIFIKVSKEKNEKYNNIKITISDNGHGIHPSIQDWIFLEEKSLKSNEGIGRGYGLFISRELIEKYGGTIKVESRENNDLKSPAFVTHFTVTLPTNL